jgi:predicted protein tyrosine phosphatase
MNPNIIISSRPLLADNLKDHNPDQLITIMGENTIDDSNDFSDLMPVGSHWNISWLRLNFLDVESIINPLGPQREHIDQIAAFDKGGSMIVCCNGGISRSSATAIGLLCCRGLSAEDACKIAFDQKPNIWPNTLILSFFDDLLAGLGFTTGGLIEAARKAKGISRCPDCFNAILTTLDEHTCPR